jgi:acetyl esterase/lipase
MLHAEVGVEPVVIELWPSTAPGEKDQVPPEYDKTTPTDDLVAGKRIIRLTDVSRPSITFYRAEGRAPKRPTMLVCPGGGYGQLSMDLEGSEICTWLNSIGINGALLKYRVPRRAGLPKHMAPLQDAQRAMGLLRHNAFSLGIEPAQIGVIGFSAGGHLAAVLCNYQGGRSYPRIDESDDLSCRPNLCILVYPAYLCDSKGELAPEVTVSSSTPTSFISVAQDDPVAARQSLLYYLALETAKVPSELHVYPSGGHGYGLRNNNSTAASWPNRAREWLDSQGFVPSLSRISNVSPKNR